ncbi:MAG: hypothetical protein EAY75_02405 [Bacteroidetes bacterium]|nr:MAG: hypothetical protein EAY75_02405 [Bacteroidota bacterium]
MRKHLTQYFLCLILSCATLASAAQNQSQIDTLLSRLGRAKTDAEKAKCYLSLGYEWSDVDVTKARGYLNLSEKYYSAAKNDSGLCDVYFNLGIMYEYDQKRDSSLLFFQKGLALGQKINHQAFLGRAYIGLGWCHGNNHDYPEAIDAYYKAIAVAEKTKNHIAWGDGLAKVANLYVQMEQMDEGLNAYRKALGQYSQANDSPNMAKVLGSLGFAYRSARRFDSAVFYLDTAIRAFRHLQYLTMIPVAYTEKGMAYLQSNRAALALSAFNEAIESHKSSPYLSHQDALYINRGKALMALGDMVAAKQNMEKGLGIALKTNDLDMQRDGYEALYLYYDTSNNYKLALENKTLYEATKDSMDGLEQKNLLRQLTTKYDFEKQQRQVEQAQFALKQRNWMVFCLVGVLLSITALGYGTYRRYRLKKEKELAEQVLEHQGLATKAVMDAEENERRRIASELHDGVGQLMSAARMNLSAFEADVALLEQGQQLRLQKIVSLVDESCKEVRTVSHSMMPNALLKRGLASALADFVQKIDQRILNVTLHTQGLEQRLDPNTETMLYRIVQECLTNVIKHSHASRLDIAIINDDDGINITIEDNGKGFDTELLKNGEGLGLKNIKSRVAYLKGEVNWDSQLLQGTLVSIHIPRVV